jgi:hypothetical protein
MEPVVTLDAAAVESLLARLDVELDEVPVFSFAARIGDGAPELAFGSVLFVPSQVAQLSWPEWAVEQGASMASLVDMWKDAGVDVSAWANFTEQRGDWLFGRLSATFDEVVSWLTSFLAGAEAEIPGGPVVRAETRAASGLIRTFEHLTSPAGLLTNQARRPTTGYFFPIVTGIAASDAPVSWDVDGYRVPSAGLWVLGLPLADPPLCSRPFDPSAPPVPGLYVGRLERRAWITDLRGEPGSEQFQVGLGFDDARISLAELELDLEEFVDGDLIAARRLRLADIALPTGPLGPGEQVVVGMPSVGPRLHRQVRLYDRDGVLLDISDRLPTIEKIEIVGIVTPGGDELKGSAGGLAPVALLDRLRRSDAAAEAYKQLLEDGLAGRVIDDPATGLPVLSGLLQEAHGDLSVLDPYFGWDVADWAILARASGSVRVLTGHGYLKNNGTMDQRVKVPPAGTASASTSFEAKSWRTGTPPWHDRFYIWAGGGLSVGTSPAGLGKRVARIDRISAVEAAGLQSLFDTWWVSADVAAL